MDDHTGQNTENNQEEETLNIPEDFANRIATKIIIINEREFDDILATKKVANLLYRNLSTPNMIKYFFDAINILIEDQESNRYGAIAWASLIMNIEEFPEYQTFVDDLLQHIIQGHHEGNRPNFKIDFKNRMFSAYAHDLGEVFISMMQLNSDLYDVITKIFSNIIRDEMEAQFRAEEEEEKDTISLVAKKKEPEKQISTKKLYDDIIDYISYRGEFRSDSLNQKNPNEFIAVLADRLRSTRRYIIQDIMNKNTLERKKQIEKSLREQEANAEEMITGAQLFKKGIQLFWEEKRYNFKYLSVEKVRVTLHVICLVLALSMLIIGYLEKFQFNIWIALISGGLMYIYGHFFCSKKFFEPFYPVDVSHELEKEVALFTPIFRKLSANSLDLFLLNQIKDPNNEQVIQLIPEFIKYIFTVISDKDKLLIKADEMQVCIEQAEINLSKFQRGRLH